MKKILLGFGFLAVLGLVGCQAGSDAEVSIGETPSVETPVVTIGGEDANVTVNVGDSDEAPTKIISALVVPKILYYHGETCPHCQALKAFLPEVEEMYPGLVIEEYEIWNNPLNAQKARNHLAELGYELEGVPAIVVEDEVISGFSEASLLALLKTHYGDPVQ